jgi:site-specific recombinase XerD
MTDQAVYDLVRAAGDTPGIDNLTSRRLRQTCIIALIAAGLDIERLQYILGHASWMTTNWYVQFAAQTNRQLSDYVTTELIDVSRKGGT